MLRMLHHAQMNQQYLSHVQKALRARCPQMTAHSTVVGTVLLVGTVLTDASQQSCHQHQAGPQACMHCTSSQGGSHRTVRFPPDLL